MNTKLTTLFAALLVLAIGSIASATSLSGNVMDDFSSYTPGADAIYGQASGATGPGVSSNAWQGNALYGPGGAGGSTCCLWPNFDVGSPGIGPFTGQALTSTSGPNWAEVTFLDTPIDEGIAIFKTDMYTNNIGIGAMLAIVGQARDTTAGQFIGFRLDSADNGTENYFQISGTSGGNINLHVGDVPDSVAGLHIEATFDLTADTLTVAYTDLAGGSISGVAGPYAIPSDLDIEMWGGHANSSNGNFGNFALMPFVPEPSSLSLLGLGGLTMLRRRR